MKTTATQKAMLSAAKNGMVKIETVAQGNTFASLARAGLMTHSSDGAPATNFDAFVIGSRVYITLAGHAAAK